jgi:hypothetical protein
MTVCMWTSYSPPRHSWNTMFTVACLTFSAWQELKSLVVCQFLQNLL